MRGRLTVLGICEDGGDIFLRITQHHNAEACSLQHEQSSVAAIVSWPLLRSEQCLASGKCLLTVILQWTCLAVWLVTVANKKKCFLYQKRTALRFTQFFVSRMPGNPYSGGIRRPERETDHSWPLMPVALLQLQSRSPWRVAKSHGKLSFVWDKSVKRKPCREARGHPAGRGSSRNFVIMFTRAGYWTLSW
jgi:hypothetical protein